MWLEQTTVAQAQKPVSHTDQTFSQMAFNRGLAEWKLGRLAMERAASPEVKQFAQRMVTDHARVVVRLERTS
jgi:putative membrane protein